MHVLVLKVYLRWDAGAVLLVNGAFVLCCLRIVCLRIFWRNSQPSAPSAAPAAADVPQAGAAEDGAGPDAGTVAAHISMTAVIQPNDEVCVYTSASCCLKAHLHLPQVMCDCHFDPSSISVSALSIYPVSGVIGAMPALHQQQQRKVKTCHL